MLQKFVFGVLINYNMLKILGDKKWIFGGKIISYLRLQWCQ